MINLEAFYLWGIIQLIKPFLMKNVFFVAIFLLTSFFGNAQTTNVEIEKDKVTLSNFKVMLHFKDIADMKRFQTNELDDLKILDKLDFKGSYSFGFTLGEATESKDGEATYAMKVEIKDVDNKETLLQEINDAMDGLAEIYELTK